MIGIWCNFPLPFFSTFVLHLTLTLALLLWYIIELRRLDYNFGQMLRLSMFFLSDKTNSSAERFGLSFMLYVNLKKTFFKYQRTKRFQ